MVTPNT